MIFLILLFFGSSTCFASHHDNIDTLIIHKNMIALIYEESKKNEELLARKKNIMYKSISFDQLSIDERRIPGYLVSTIVLLDDKISGHKKTVSYYKKNLDPHAPLSK